jgi:hypothetical protein
MDNGGMFPRYTQRMKDGKEHRYWSIVENRRGADKRVQPHVLYLAYCLYVTVEQRLRALAPGLTSRAVIEKMSSIQMVDVYLPTTGGQLLILPRHRQPENDHQLLAAAAPCCASPATSKNLPTGRESSRKKR